MPRRLTDKSVGSKNPVRQSVGRDFYGLSDGADL